MAHSPPMALYFAETPVGPRASARAGYWMLTQEETDASEMPHPLLPSQLVAGEGEGEH